MSMVQLKVIEFKIHAIKQVFSSYNMSRDFMDTSHHIVFASCDAALGVSHLLCPHD